MAEYVFRDYTYFKPLTLCLRHFVLVENYWPPEYAYAHENVWHLKYALVARRLLRALLFEGGDTSHITIDGICEAVYIRKFFLKKG